MTDEAPPRGLNHRDAEPTEAGEQKRQIPERLNRLCESTIGAAIEVHRHLGPGFLESAYEAALELELRSRSIRFERQVALLNVPLLKHGIRRLLWDL